MTISSTPDEVISVSNATYQNGIQNASLADDAYFTSPHPPDQQHSPPGSKVCDLKKKN